MDDQEFDARLRAFDERQVQFLDRLDALERSDAAILQRFEQRDEWVKERLELLDQRDVAFLQQQQRMSERLDLLSGQSGQVAEDLVVHKRDPNAHS